MKHLALIRHAKSDWNDPTAQSDHDRPLNKRGRKAAPAVGAELARMGLRPDLVVSSTAVRAATTARAIAAEIGFDPGDIVMERSLYNAEAAEWISQTTDTRKIKKWKSKSSLTRYILSSYPPRRDRARYVS